MSIDYSYRVLDEKKKQIEIKYGDRTLKFQLKIKRSFTVLKALLEAYPDIINIHSLDNILHDPNRAHSDLRLSDGFGGYLIEKRGKRRVMWVKLDVDKLFNKFDTIDPDEFIQLSRLNHRKTLTKEQRDIIFTNFNGRCNITRIKLHRKLSGRHFFKSALLANYDHRVPLSRGGKDELNNMHLISQLANDEKNRICNNCRDGDCRYCALAYPEKYSIIQANGQRIDELRKEE